MSLPLAKAEQPSNTRPSVAVSDFGRVMLANLEQPLKDWKPSVVTPSGMTMPVRLLLNNRALLPNFVTVPS